MSKIRNKFSVVERRMVFEYYQFIKSDWWTKQKEDWYSRHKKRCARCKKEKNIHLHHKAYPKAGRYLSLEDNAFVALCGGCHKMYHDKYGVQRKMQKTSNKFIKNGKSNI